MFGTHGFPLGLPGLYKEKVMPTLTDKEDWVRNFIDTADPGLCAIVYKALHAIGYRIDACPKMIADYKKRLDQGSAS